MEVDAKNPFYHFAKGLSEYRQGRFDKALTILKGDAATVMGPAPRLIEAMAVYRRGETSQAKQILAAAINMFDWLPERMDNRNARIYEILRREAETLISTK